MTDLKVGDKLLIINDRVKGKLLSNVYLGEIITVTGFGQDNKFLYHHSSLALPIMDGIYLKLKTNSNGEIV